MRNAIVLKKYKLVIFCIPKVASTSIKATILNSLGVKYKEKNIHRLHRYKELHMSEIYTVYKKYNDFFKAAIVRNPFDRLVSCYEDKIKNRYYFKREKFYEIGFKHEMTFNEFIVQVCKNPFASNHFGFQLPMISFGNEELADYVGKFESLNETWETIKKYSAEKSCLKIVDLKHLNQSKTKKHYSKYYNGKTKRMVGNTFKMDLKNFGYEYKNQPR